MASGTVEFENAEAIASSDKALLIQFEDREEPVWIPQGQIHDDSEVYRRGDKGKLVLTEWIATEKGLI